MDKSRENYIIGRALYETVRRLERLPDDQRPQADIDDMVELLNSRYADVLDMMSKEEEMKSRFAPPVARLVPRAKPPDEKT